MAEQNFEDMRQQAIRRVMDMQRMAQGLTGTGGGSGGESMSGENQRQNQNQSNSSAQSHEPPAAERGGSLTDLLNGFDIDEEKALILLLIYILWKNGADKKLLFGLGYLVI